MTDAESLTAFLGLFFGGLVPPGLIEGRIIHEKGTDSRYTAQRWFRSIPDLVGALDALNAEGEQHQSAVYFGVLPRDRESGRRQDVSRGRVVWADLDFDQYEGGEAEARSMLFHFPLSPSAVVRSGHGLHGYWALEEAVTADECSRLAKRVELALRSDHVSDAPRIMRLPFSFNRKHGGATLVELEQLHDEDAYTPADLERFTPAVGAPDAAKPAPARRPVDTPAGVTRAVAPVEAQLPDEVAALFGSSRTLAELYVGRGKQTGDQSTSGYDMSFAVALVKKGIVDPDVLARAIAARPNTRANDKGARYIHDTVAKALETQQPKAAARPGEGAPVQRSDAQPALFAVDFTVERVVIYTSDPPVYEFVIDGRRMKLSAEQLLRVARFEQRFFEVFNRMTKLPSAKEKAAWRDLVNGWLAGAERIEQPPETSREAQLREAIEDFAADIQVGSDAADLDRDRALLTAEGDKAFKTKTVMKALKANFRDVGAHAVGATMRGMGLAYRKLRFDGTQARVWVMPVPSTNGKHDPNDDPNSEADEGGDDVPF